MNSPRRRSTSGSPFVPKARLLLRRSADATFLYPSDIKKSSVKRLGSYTLKPLKKTPTHPPVAYQDEDVLFTRKETISPTSTTVQKSAFQAKESPLGIDMHHQARLDKPTSSPENVDKLKENEEPDKERKSRSPVLQSRRSRRKSRKLALQDTASMRHGNNQELTESCKNKVIASVSSKEFDASSGKEQDIHELSSTDLVLRDIPLIKEGENSEITGTCQTEGVSSDLAINANANRGMEQDIHDLNSVDFSKIFSDCFSQDLNLPIRSTVSSSAANKNITLPEKCDKITEMEENQSNNTFNSTFSCTDEELLACVCDEPGKDKSTSVGSIVETPTIKITNFSTNFDASFSSIAGWKDDENGVQMFGFKTASRKDIKISKTALERAENLLCRDIFGDPL